MKEYPKVTNDRYKTNPVLLPESHKMDNIRTVVKMLDNEIQSKCPEGQYKEIALIRLQECSMWINKSISHGKY